MARSSHAMQFARGLPPLAGQIDALDQEIAAIDAELEKVAKADDRTRRLMTIPGVGPITATALAATVADIEAFASGREFSAFLGLTPRQHSSGGKESRGGSARWVTAISRKLLVVGATSALYRAGGHKDALRRWVAGFARTQGRVQVRLQADGGGARQQAGAHRLRHPALGRGLRRPTGRGRDGRKRLGEKEFRPRASRHRG